jgi:peptidoglycan/xylan/chitin deacetylase (PgdA/CDA1 family)
MGHLGLSRFVRSILPVTYRLPMLRALSSRSPIILLYHGVPPRSANGSVDAASFERHVLFLKHSCEMVTQESIGTRRKASDRLQVLLSFDDGMRNNLTVVAPILERHGVPALFFVSSRHATPGKYLWFVYLRALETHFPGNGFQFRDQYIDLKPAVRHASVERLREFLLTLTPHPAAMYQVIDEELPRLEDFLSEQVIADSYAGMTAEQVSGLAGSPLFSLGIHTVDHPLLTKCATPELTRQVQDNRSWIEGACSRPCNVVAYPSGDYNEAVVEQTRTLGITHGYAVVPHNDRTSLYEIPRVGIYAASLDVLGFKVYWGNHLRRFKVGVG